MLISVPREVLPQEEKEKEVELSSTDDQLADDSHGD